MIDFPASPTVGQQYTSGGVTWTWDGTKWTAGGLSVAYLPLAGGTMTGPLVLAADPAAALQPATKQYVDGGRLGDNRIINGDMRIDQRNNGASGTANGYTVDRWGYNNNTGAARGSWVRGGPFGNTTAFGFPYDLQFTSSGTYTSAAGDICIIYQNIEADQISDFAFGTTGAKPITLSFWAWSSLGGLFGGVFRNYAATRTYPFSYSLAATTWTFIVVTIPGDTAGTWVTSGNAGAASLIFDLGSGSSQRGPAGAWASAAYTGATGTVSTIGTNSAIFSLTGVKLEVGSIATPFNRQSLAKSLADCQRYYEIGTFSSNGSGANAGNGVGYMQPFSVTKRAAPTMDSSGTTATNVNSTALNPTMYGFQPYANLVASGGYIWAGNYTASAEL